MNTPSFADSIERYAELCARLDTAFRDRGATLAAADLDESRFIGLQAQWTAQLLSPTGPEIADRFGAAYAAARRALASSDLKPEEEDTWPSDPAREDRTEQIRCLPHTPVLPFRRPPAPAESSVRLSPAPRRIHEPPIRPAPRDADDCGTTMEVPVFAQPPQVLPFVEKASPVRWLHRFDTQTGLPLPAPRWSEEAPADPAPTTPR